jgi:peptide chain release factor
MIAVQITSGQGPVECQWVVARVREAMVAEAVVQGIQVHDVDICSGDVQGCLRSCSLLLDGGKEETVANQWVGTIQWIGKSLFRPQHRRRNWFVGIDVFLLPERIEWSAEEVRIEAMRSSGPGGQHVNKTASAIRATHIPTGVAVVARDERSQHRNRALALARLAAALAGRSDVREADLRHGRWKQHASLERGNPVRVFEGPGFRERMPHA